MVVRVEFFAACRDHARPFVQRDVVDDDLLGRRRAPIVRTGAARRRMASILRAQLARIERLRQVVVGAQLEAENPVLLVASRGQHQHGHPRARRGRGEAPRSP